jgi:hypothetical protein
MKISQGGLVDKNRNTLRQLLHLSPALALALVLSFTVTVKAQNTQPGTPMPPTATQPPQQVPPDTAAPPDTPPPPEQAQPVGPTPRPEPVGPTPRPDPTPAPEPNPTPGAGGVTERDVAEMSHFLDQHPEIAEQLRKDPSLIDNPRFVSDHPALAEYLKMHPNVRNEFDSNPNAFMRAEDRYDRREEANGHYDYGITREELASMNHFLDSHPEIAEQLRKDPSLIDNRQFIANHPALQEYLQQHPRVSAEFRDHPNVFMHDEERYDARREDPRGYPDRDRDFDRREVSSFGEFLRGHTTTADALTNDPTLANNREFLETHPDLREYLQAHPQMQQQLSANPQAVMTSPALAGTTTPPHKGMTTTMPVKPDQPIKPEPEQH